MTDSPLLIPGSGTLDSRWRTLTSRGAQTSHPWWTLFFSSLSYLILELSVLDGELWPEEECKLLIHDGLCSCLLFRMIVKLSVPDGELWPEEVRKPFTNDRLYFLSCLLYLIVELTIADRELWPEEERTFSSMTDSVLLFSFVPWIVKLFVPNGELWPEEEWKLLIHDKLCSSLSFVPETLHSKWRTWLKRGAQVSHQWQTLFPFFSSAPHSRTIYYLWRTSTREGAQIFQPWLTLFFSSLSSLLVELWPEEEPNPWQPLFPSYLPYLVAELSVPNGELWPEEERKLLIHDRFCSSLLFGTW